MLQKFLIATHAIAMPDLEEYNWRSNKVSVTGVLQKHCQHEEPLSAAIAPLCLYLLPVQPLLLGSILLARSALLST